MKFFFATCLLYLLPQLSMVSFGQSNDSVTYKDALKDFNKTVNSDAYKSKGQVIDFTKAPGTREIKGLEFNHSGDHVVIRNSSKGLTFAKTWVGFDRPEYGGSKIYPSEFHLSFEYELDVKNESEYGFGMAFIFHRIGKYTADTIVYVSFFLTNQNKIYFQNARKEYNETSRCLSCWGAFKKDTPKKIQDASTYESKPLHVKTAYGKNKLNIFYNGKHLYLFLNNELILEVKDIKNDVDYDVTPIPLLRGKGDIKIYNQSEKYLYPSKYDF